MILVRNIKQFSLKWLSHKRGYCSFVLTLLDRLSDSTSCCLFILILCFLGAPDKPCGGGHTDANSKTVAIRYMIENKLVPLHYES